MNTLAAGSRLAEPCHECGVALGIHHGEPFSCNGFRSRPAPIAVRLVEAALLDAVTVAITVRSYLKRKKVSR